MKKRNIESSTTEIVDEDVPLLLGLSGAETVGDSGGGRLLDLLAELGLSNLLHLWGGLVAVPKLFFRRIAYLDKDHGGDLLGGELLGFAEVLDLDHGGVASGNDLEGP